MGRLIVCRPASGGGGGSTLTDGGTFTLTPFYIPLNIFSTTGAWKITTGASVTVIAMGSFTV